MRYNYYYEAQGGGAQVVGQVKKLERGGGGRPRDGEAGRDKWNEWGVARRSTTKPEVPTVPELSTEDLPEIKALEGGDVTMTFNLPKIAHGVFMLTVKFRRENQTEWTWIAESSTLSMNATSVDEKETMDLTFRGVTTGQEGIYRCFADTIDGAVANCGYKLKVLALVVRATFSPNEMTSKGCRPPDNIQTSKHFLIFTAELLAHANINNEVRGRTKLVKKCPREEILEFPPYQLDGYEDGTDENDGQKNDGADVADDQHEVSVNERSVFDVNVRELLNGYGGVEDP
ncbi:hypothetical protein Btru_077438 [Bulinus truncatus]|nr:hypothetical protein Btru_077438 [Bulinus truncatus]